MIAITGAGVVSSYGVGLELFREGISSHQGISSDTRIDLARYGLKEAGFIRDFSSKKYIPAMKARRMSRVSQLALIASREAWDNAGRETPPSDPERSGVIVGTGLGSVSSTDAFFEGLLLRGPLETNPMIFPETVQNIAAAHISIELGIRGPNTTFSQGDVAGEQALYYAVQLLRERIADTALVCGVDELSEILLLGMRTLRLLSKTSCLCPFDKRRDGIVPSEGAAALVLERKEDAEKRGAKIWGYVRGIGANTDSVGRFSYSSPEYMKNAMEMALKEAGCLPDFISASANSTRELDFSEASAIRALFGHRIPVTALKSQTGSFMASGIMKIVAALLSMGEGFIPPVFGLVDPEMPGIDYVMDTPRQQPLRSGLVNSFSHGGANICVMVAGPDQGGDA